MSRLADALSVLRLVAAVAFPGALARGGWLPVVLFLYGAASDYVDGPLARRGGRPHPWGGVLDNVADIAFVLGAAATGAVLGRIGWWAPAAILASVAGYAAASRRLAAAAGAPRLARSRIGHAAGVANWVLAGALAAQAAAPVPAAVVAATAAGVAAINAAAIASRLAARVATPTAARPRT